STSRRRIASSAGRVLTRLPFRQSPVGRVLTRLLPRYPQHQDQELSRRDGASHLSLLVQGNLAQRKHPPPARPAQRQPFSRLREKVPGGRMRGRAQRAALDVFLLEQHQDQGLSRRDGASQLSLRVQGNLAQRKHTPPARPVLRTGSAEPAGFSEEASKPPRKTPRILARRPSGLVRRLRRSEGAPNVKSLKSR